MRVARKTWKSRFLALLLAASSMAGFVVSAPEVVSAADGRAITPDAEIAAQYIHSLDRQPDATGYNSYMWFVNKDCRWGIMDASFKIANSAEAHQRWRDNPQDLAGMLYASLLNRAPDAGGLQTYTEAIRTRGLEWATASMLASPEYNARLDALCAGRRSSNARMMTWDVAADYVQDFVDWAGNLTVGCGVGKGMQQLQRLQKTAGGITQFVGRAAWLGNQINSQFKLDRTCAAVVTYLRASVKMGDLITAGGGYNPVFMQYDTDKLWYTANFITEFKIRMGPEPTHWDLFEGRAL